MAALSTVQKYVDRSRALLQDTSAPYRYSDADLVAALNLAIIEARRLRPDLMRSFFRAVDGLPEYSESSLSAEVEIDVQYRMAFVYYIVGHTQLRDEEDVTDARASVFLNKFTSQLLAIQS